jgi:dTDP-glucose 4,6-dehydratase
LENLREVDGDPRYKFFEGDICDYKLVAGVCRENKIEYIVNFAAESHVDRSIHSGLEFIRTDVEGTYTLLCVTRDLGLKRLHQISTDEVYGDIEKNQFSKETDRIQPSSPYSASKAGGDLQCLSFFRTYGTPVTLTRATNNYGTHMYPEKILPLFITNLLEGKKVPVYGDGLQIRDWLHVNDHCRAIDLVLRGGRVGEVYNVGANLKPEISNIEVTKKLLDLLGEDKSKIEYVSDRPGHDRRYAVDTTKIKLELGWQPQVEFLDGLREMVNWYKNNETWWKKLKSGEYLEYYQKQYNQLGKS